MTYKAGLFTISVAIILFTSVGASSAPFISANTESDQVQTEIQEFSSGAIIATSSTTLTKAMEFMDNIIVELSSETDPKVGPAVSQAAQLHKLFAHEDKSIKKQFQEKFLAFIKQVKDIVGVGNGVTEKLTLNELDQKTDNSDNRNKGKSSDKGKALTKETRVNLTMEMANLKSNLLILRT